MEMLAPAYWKKGLNLNRAMPSSEMFLHYSNFCIKEFMYTKKKISPNF
jgi:hypothetical protein